MENNHNQGVLVISFGKLSELQLIENIIGPDFDHFKLIEKKIGPHTFSSYPFNLNTKYYETEIYFYQTTCSENLEPPSLADPIQSVIAYFDVNDESSYNTFLQWSSVIDDINPEIRLLVCDTAKHNSVVPRTTILKWCVNHEFELIELEPEEVEEDELEDDFKESNGIKRIVEALSAHTWPKISMKEATNYKPLPQFKGMLMTRKDDQEKKELEKEASTFKKDISLDELNSKIDAVIEENKLMFEGLDSEDKTSFEVLFARFKDLKEKAENLKGEELRIYAEKVALAFWNAIGSDDDEPEELLD